MGKQMAGNIAALEQLTFVVLRENEQHGDAVYGARTKDTIYRHLISAVGEFQVAANRLADATEE